MLLGLSLLASSLRCGLDHAVAVLRRYLTDEFGNRLLDPAGNRITEG